MNGLAELIQNGTLISTEETKRLFEFVSHPTFDYFRYIFMQIWNKLSSYFCLLLG